MSIDQQIAMWVIFAILVALAAIFVGFLLFGSKTACAPTGPPPAPPTVCRHCGTMRYGAWITCQKCWSDFCSTECWNHGHGRSRWGCFQPELKSDGQPECFKESQNAEA